MAGGVAGFDIQYYISIQYYIYIILYIYIIYAQATIRCVQVYRDYVKAVTEWRAGLFFATAIASQFLMIYKVRARARKCTYAHANPRPSRASPRPPRSSPSVLPSEAPLPREFKRNAPRNTIACALTRNQTHTQSKP